MPYDERATVEHHGRMITESVAPGSFKGIQRRLTGRGIKANRDHDVSKVCGKVVGVYPDNEAGLVADIRMARTDLGNETLSLADDGLLDASAGFLPLENGEHWPSRDERRLTRVYLGHVAFVSEPAFEGAKVLAVRSADVSPTPYRDELEAWMLSQQFGKLQASR
jgi:HK97 family phage prohead protease